MAIAITVARLDTRQLCVYLKMPSVMYEARQATSGCLPDKAEVIIEGPASTTVCAVGTRKGSS